MNFSAFFLRLLVALLAPGSLSALPVGINPSFESGLNGWTHANVSVETVFAFEGANRLDLQKGFIEQTFTGLIPGQTHRVRLAYMAQTGTGTLADARIKIDGVTIGGIHNGQANEYLGANGFEFVPSATSAALRIESLETGSAGLLVDLVRIELGGMPAAPEQSWQNLTQVADTRGGRALVNGGFESPLGNAATDPDNSGPAGNEHLSGFSLPGWRVTRENVDVIRVGNANPPQGANVLDAGGHGPGGFAQTITGLTPGGGYMISFLHARHISWGTADMTGEIRINGQPAYPVVRTSAQTWTNGYSLAEVPATAGPDGKLTLEVLSTTLDQGGNIVYDDFRITAAAPPPEPTGPIRVLVIEGASNHDWQRRVDIFRNILSRDGSFQMDVSLVPQDMGSPEWAAWNPVFSNYDVVLSGYRNAPGNATWPVTVQTAFATYIQNGGGFYAFHEANQAFTDWQEYQKIVGLAWHDAATGTAFTVNPDSSLLVHPPGSGLATGHGNRADSLVTRRTSHPIHGGLPNSWFAADLEVVRFPRGIDPAVATSVTILSHSIDPDPPAGQPALNHPVEWTVSYGSGRVYASTYGHIWSDQQESPGMRCAAFHETFVRALKWCAGRNPGTAVPSDFPTTAVSLRAYSEGVAGFGGAKAVAPFANGALPTLSIVPTQVDTLEAFPNLAWESPIVALPWPGGASELFVAEMDGRIFHLPDQDTATPAQLATVLDLRDRVWYMNWDIGVPTHKHGGILGCAFHPKFGQAQGKDFLYVYYLHHPTDSPDATVDAFNPYYSRLSRFTWNPTNSTFDPASELIMIQQFDTARGHDGGGLVFGGDGCLYLSLGDEGTESGDSTPHTQKLNDRVRSGVWRMDVDQRGTPFSHPIVNQPAEPPLQPGETNINSINHTYTQGYHIPNDNPWVGVSGALEEFYAIGLREPHRMTYDAVANRFWIGDVGAGAWEEVNVMDAPSLNFQWNYKEGNAAGFRAAPSPLIGTERAPVHAYDHTGGNCVIGGYVYRGTAIPELTGKYIFGDNSTQLYYSMEYDGQTQTAGAIQQIGQGRAGTIWNGISSFGVDSSNELLLLQMGAGTAGNGRISRIKRAGTITGETWEHPALLSQTGLFTNLATLTPAAGLVPYEVNMPLWSSGLSKKRWVMIPNDGIPNSPAEQITYSENHAWQFPVGTVFVKHFARPDNNAPLETRILVHGKDGWGGVTYKWHPGGNEADLAEDGEVENLTLDGQTFEYLYPSRNQCWQCHQAGTGPVLGFRTRQLNRDTTYPNGITANQVESFSAAGFIPRNLREADLVNVITSADIDDPDLSDERFVRSYLDSNCSHCHQPDGSSRAFFDARLITPLTNQSLVCGPLIDGLNLPSPAVLKPGSLENSVLFHRVTSISPSVAMPPIARGPVDYNAASRIANWLLSMNADSCTKSQSFFGGGELGIATTPVLPGGTDSWRSNMVIQKNAVFTNTYSSPITLRLDRFSYHAKSTGDPLTPFLVKVNAPGNFTVVAIGTTRTGYSPGANNTPFADSPVTITVLPGESIAPGFLDANPNGSGGSGPESITWTAGGNTVWHGGGPLDSQAGSLAVGSAPAPGANLLANQSRTYHFAVSYIISSLKLGNRVEQPGYRLVDGANSNFVINYTESFTNPTAETLTISVDRFRFEAERVTDPVTPFIVRLHGTDSLDDFTLLAIGDPQTNYTVGINDQPFSGGPAVISVAPGETIAPGFVDGLPDGTPGTGNGAVSFIYSEEVPDGGDLVFYRYDDEQRGVTLELGQSPVVPFRYPEGGEFRREYLFSITLGFGGKSDEDGDGLRDAWELAFAPGLSQLSAQVDSDGDGMNNLAEFEAGTDPTDRTSIMKTLAVSPDPAGAAATIQTVPGRSYQVRVSGDLSAWTDAGVFKAADWPAAKTPIILPTTSLPPESQQKLFIQVGPAP